MFGYGLMLNLRKGEVATAMQVTMKSMAALLTVDDA